MSMTNLLSIMYTADTSEILRGAAAQDEPLTHITLCGCAVQASLLSDVLRRHARTLRDFDMSEVTFVVVLDKEGAPHSVDASQVVFDALATATGLEVLCILTSRDALRLSRTDRLVDAIGHMPCLASVQFCRTFTSEVQLNAAIRALSTVHKLTIHYEDACSEETLDAIVTLAKKSVDVLTSFELVGCPNMLKNKESNVHLCDTLVKCHDLEYVCICESDLDDESAKAMRSTLSESKAHRVEISTKKHNIRIRAES